MNLRLIFLCLAVALALPPVRAQEVSQPIRTAAVSGVESQLDGAELPSIGQHIRQPAATAPAPKSAESGPPSIFDEGKPVATEFASIVVGINTSRNQDAIDTFTLYPYPVKPPVCAPLPRLPYKEKTLLAYIAETAFRNRPDLKKPYQPINWRWTYAYKAALRKSGRGEPHTLLSQYTFARDLLPLVAHEVKLRNEFEDERRRRYERTVEEWERTHHDGENEAIRKGLTPIHLQRRQWSLAKGDFPAGTWWLQVRRKVPGVVYYWLEPITAAADQKLEILLNDDNALAILGGW